MDGFSTRGYGCRNRGVPTYHAESQVEGCRGRFARKSWVSRRRMVDRSALISESDGQKRTWRIGALSSPLLSVPWSVVENEQPRMVGSETTRPRHESYGDCDAEVRVIAGTGMDTGGSTASHATIN